jgi:hypothetical protein
MGIVSRTEAENRDGGAVAASGPHVRATGASRPVTRTTQLKPMFSLEGLDLRYEPFPYGIASPLFDDGLYRELVASFPSREYFGLNRINVKYVLSERVNRRQYRAFLRSTPLWKEFHRWIKSDEFIRGVLDQLALRHVDLGYRQRPRLSRLARRILFGLSGRRDYRTSLGSRFEFSMLPADGGMVIPHTDSPSKVVTMVLPMVAEGEWDQSLGGNTDINVPTVDRLRYNAKNGKGDFDEMAIAESLAFEANRALVFVRTYNSWHSVRPMTAQGSSALRRTVTVTLLER